MKTAYALIAGFALSTLMTPAFAAGPCAEFTLVGDGMDVELDAFNPVTVENKAFLLRVRRLDPSVTSVNFMFVDPSPVGSLPGIGVGGPADYSITLPTNPGRPVLALNTAVLSTTNGALANFSRRDDTDLVAFRLAIRPDNAGFPVDATQPLTLAYQCFSGSTAVDTQQSQNDGRVAINLFYDKGVAARVEGSSLARLGLINLGSFDPGDQLEGSARLTAQTLSPYRIEVSTDNRRNLESRDGSKLPYDIMVDGSPLGARSKITCPATPAPTGREHKLDVQVDTTRAATMRAGSFADVITVTFSVFDGAPSACSVN